RRSHDLRQHDGAGGHREPGTLRERRHAAPDEARREVTQAVLHSFTLGPGPAPDTPSRRRPRSSDQSTGTKMQWRILPSTAFERWPLPVVSSTRMTSPALITLASPSLAVI